MVRLRRRGFKTAAHVLLRASNARAEKHSLGLPKDQHAASTVSPSGGLPTDPTRSDAGLRDSSGGFGPRY